MDKGVVIFELASAFKLSFFNFVSKKRKVENKLGLSSAKLSTA